MKLGWLTQKPTSITLHSITKLAVHLIVYTEFKRLCIQCHNTELIMFYSYVTLESSLSIRCILTKKKNKATFSI